MEKRNQFLFVFYEIYLLKKYGFLCFQVFFLKITPLITRLIVININEVIFNCPLADLYLPAVTNILVSIQSVFWFGVINQ